jgi:hypothetical protein
MLNVQHQKNVVNDIVIVATVSSIFLTLFLIITCNISSVQCLDDLDVDDDSVIISKCFIQDHKLYCSYDAFKVSCPIYNNIVYLAILMVNIGALILSSLSNNYSYSQAAQN